MIRHTAALALLLVACGDASSPEPVQTQAEAIPEVVMDEAMITLPQSELDMLEEEIAFLRAETTRMQTELTESKSAPAPMLGARHARARGQLLHAESELRRLKEELTETKVRLADAEAKGEALEQDLTETREVLVQTTERLSRTERTLRTTRDDLEGALRVAADAGWSDLVAKSQVSLCDKGSRNKMASCRADARQVVAPLESAARACLRAGHAAPAVQGRDRGEDMPRQAVWIGRTDRDWYVVLCDPNLPEAQALLADLDERGRPSSARDDAEDTEDALRDFDDEPVEDMRVAKRAQSRDQGVARTAREERVTRSNRDEPAPVRRTREPAPEPLEPPELREASAPSVSLSSLGLEDLDADSGDDGRTSRAERRQQKKEEEALEKARRDRNTLDGAGDDLIDEI